MHDNNVTPQSTATPHCIEKQILYLYGYQTSDEQMSGNTSHSNGEGFSMVDAPFMTSLAQQIIAGRNLSDKQIGYADRILTKYRKTQLSNEQWKAVQLPEKKESSSWKPNNDPSKGDGILTIEEHALTFYPNVYPSKQIKTIGFGRWTGKAWVQTTGVPTRKMVAKVRQLFPNIVLDSSIEEFLDRKPVALPQQILDNGTLYDFQKETIQFQLTSKHALVALAPRLGKTVTCIFAAKAAECNHILVISPLSLLFDWKAKIKRWGNEDAGLCYKQQLVPPARWVVTNYDTVRIRPQKFLEEKWDCIIVDESLLVKNRKAKRTETIKELVRNVKPEYLWLLSGAPISRLYDDLWSQLNIIDPKRFSSYWRFVEDYCILESNEWSKYNIIGNKPDASELIKEDLADIYFHRTQEDVLDLPPWNIENVEIPMGKYQDKVYAEMEYNFLAELGEDNSVLAPNHLAQMVRLIQLASNPALLEGKDESNKWSAVLEMLQFEELPVIVWANFIPTAKFMRDKIIRAGFSVELLTGATPALERGKIVDRFQDGQLDVVIAHPAVGKYGLDLYKAKTVIYMERDWNGDNYFQSLNRVRHVDAQYAPHIIQLLSCRSGEEGGETIDHVIDKILQSRRESVMKLTCLDIRNLFGGETA